MYHIKYIFGTVVQVSERKTIFEKYWFLYGNDVFHA